MTAQRRDGIESPFSNWIRNEPRLDSIQERLSVTDCDYWLHQYRAHTDRIGERLIDSIMLMEVKTHCADLPFSQRDTLRLLNYGLHSAFRDSRGNVITQRQVHGDSEIRLVRFYGAFLLRLDGNRPDTSNAIQWHGRLIDLDTLIGILTFKVDPRTLRSRAERRHHAPIPKRIGDLFVVNR